MKRMGHNPGKKQPVSARLDVCVSDNDYRKALGDWVESMTAEESRKPLLVIGNRTYTPAQVLREVRRRSAIGKFFLRSLRKLRILKAS